MRKDALVIGLAIFAMFFGAGNLIFPPFLGMESGSDWPIGFLCFVLVDVVLACAGVYLMNASGGAVVAVERALGHRSGLLLASVGVLLIGTLIAMPRTAATTYELGISPLFGDTVGLLPFSIIFFAFVFLMAYKESRVLDIIGKVFTPILVLGVFILLVAGFVNPIGEVGEPLIDSAARVGIQAGYQTMDVLGVIGFAIIVQDTVRSHGIVSRTARMKVIGRAMIIAAVLLALIYGGLAYLGATARSLGTDLSEGALIVAITQRLLGEFGMGMFGIIVTVACLTTAVGLVGSTASYFHRLTHEKLGYVAGVALECIVGVLICNLGLDTIIALAEPVLAVVCPPFVTTIVLMLFRRHIRSNWVYRGAALASVIAATVIAFHTYGGYFPWVESLPLYRFDFAWLPFAVIGSALGLLGAKLRGSMRDRASAFAPPLDPVQRFYPKARASKHVRAHAHMKVYSLERERLLERAANAQPS